MFGRLMGDPIFHHAQRVEKLRDGCTPGGTEFMSHQPAQPIVTVDQVVAVALFGNKIQCVIDELRQIWINLVWIKRLLWPRWDMNYTGVLAQRLIDVWDARILTACEHIDLDATPSKFAAEITHINVHTARLFTT